MGIVEALLVFSVTAFYFTVVPGRIGTNQFVPYAQIIGCLLEKGFEFALCGRKAVRELEAVVRLYALHFNSFARKGFDYLSQKIGRGIGTLLRIGAQNSVA